MPYALTNFTHGFPPSAAYIANEADAPEGAIVHSDEDRDKKRNWVWDSSTSSLRARTSSEELEVQKVQVRHEMQNRTRAAVDRIFPVPGHYASLARRRPNDPRVAQADAVMDRLDTLLTAIDNAQNINALNAIRDQGF